MYSIFITLSAHAREGYSCYFVCLSVCLSVCHFSILEKEPFSGLKLTPVHSGFKSFKCSTFLKIELKIEAILEKKRVELRPQLQYLLGHLPVIKRFST